MCKLQLNIFPKQIDVYVKLIFQMTNTWTWTYACDSRQEIKWRNIETITEVSDYEKI